MTFKDISNASIYRLKRVLLKIQLFIQFDLGCVKKYQPNPFLERDLKDDTCRLCSDRFETVSKLLPDVSQPTVMDIGCNIGYFIFKMSERGGFGIGFDIGRNEIMAARAIACINKVNNVGFSQFNVTPETVEALPSVDVTFCLSIFHHWVRYYGLKGATRIMNTIFEKTNVIVFETGQSDEVSMSWAEQLAFMGNDPKEWVQKFLIELGFDKVLYAGKFDTSVSDVKRNLFVGIKKKGNRVE